MMYIIVYDTFNQVIKRTIVIGTVTTTIGMASMRTGQKLIEVYED